MLSKLCTVVSYLTENTVRDHYKDQPAVADDENNRFFIVRVAGSISVQCVGRSRCVLMERNLINVIRH